MFIAKPDQWTRRAIVGNRRHGRQKQIERPVVIQIRYVQADVTGKIIVGIWDPGDFADIPAAFVLR